MSNLEASIKTADKLSARLFNHKQFTTGEINFILNEIGKKLEVEDNFENFLKVDEKLCLIYDLNNNDLPRFDSSIADRLIDQVESAVLKARHILEFEESFASKRCSALIKPKEDHDVKIRDCRLKTNDKLRQLKTTLDREEVELRDKYKRFEENLRGN